MACSVFPFRLVHGVAKLFLQIVDWTMNAWYLSVLKIVTFFLYHIYTGTDIDTLQVAF